MPRPPGSLKTPGSGRQKGSKNKRTLIGGKIAEILESCALDPVEKLIKEVYPMLQPDGQAKVLLELTSYLYPKRKAVELSGPAGDSISMSHSVDLSAIVKDNPDAMEDLLKAEKILSGFNKGQPDAGI